MSLRHPSLLLLAIATVSAGCDSPPSPDAERMDASFRSAEAEAETETETEIVTLEAGGLGESTAVALDGDIEGQVVWTVHPPDPGAVACVAGVGAEAYFAPAAPGIYTLRASVLEPESVEVSYTVETKVIVEGRRAIEECVAAAVPDGIMPSADEVSGIDPTPFHDEVSGIDPTPFYEAVAGIDPTPFHEDVAGIEPTPFLAVLFEDGRSISAGCFCAYE